MSHYFRWIIAVHIATALVVTGLYLTQGSADAQETAPVPSAIQVLEIDANTIIDPVSVTVQLTDASGQPVGAVANEALEVYMGGEKVRRARTEADGTLTFSLKNEFPAGTHQFTVLYFGSKSLAPAILRAEFTVKPAVLEIVTIPPVADVSFSLADQAFTSDKYGIARVNVDQQGEYRLEVHPEDTETRWLRFNRWRDEVFDPFRQVDIKRVQHLEVGFDVSYKVEMAFHDLQGLAVDPERISRVVLRSSHGTEAILEAPNLGTAETGSIWLQAGRVVRRFHGLEETLILWSVDAVEIDGTNVVNRAQQRFFVEENDFWELELLLYEARFTARDALFGFPLGEGVNLEYPNGTVEVVEFEGAAQVNVESLPRGEYRVNVADAPGYSPYSPVALSRDQEVHLLVISYLDIGVAVFLLVMLAAGLVVIGRPSLLSRVRISGGTARLRNAFVVVAALTLLTGVAILSFGLGKEPPSLSAQSLGSTGPQHDPITSVGPDFTTGDPEEEPSEPYRWLRDVGAVNDEDILFSSRPAPPVAGVFQSFWERNGAYAVFGAPLSPPDKTLDPETGLKKISQDFQFATLEFDETYAGTAAAIQLRDLGSIHADQSGLSTLNAFAPLRDQPRPEGDCRHFKETDHFVCDEFLEYWYAKGLKLNPHASSFQESLALYGYPISEAFEDPETGRTIQYFERVRLELFPEHSGTPHVVQQADLKGVGK